MRILMLVHSLRRGGAERVLLELATGLQQRGHVVEVVSWLDVDEYNDACYKSISRHYLLSKADYRWVRSIPKSAAKLRPLVQQFKPDVIEIHTPNVAWVAAWANLGVPCVHVLHGYGDITRYGSFRAFLIRHISRLVAWRLKAVFITVSNSMIPVASRYFGVGSSNIQFILNGINLNKFSFTGGTFKGNVSIIIIGTLSQNKGQALGIMAFKKVLDAIPAAKLHIVGDGKDRGGLQNLIDAHQLNGRVHLLGCRADVPELLATSHLLWQLSESEAMPMVVLEAMATGLPVIGFDVRGTRDAVVDKETGFLVPYGDIGAVAAATVRLMQDSSAAMAMSVASRSRAEKYFSLGGMIEKHERVLRESANGI